MASAVCCTSIEVKYRKKGGGCKVVNDRNIPVSETDRYLNSIINKNNFHSLLGVRMFDIHQRPVSSAMEEDSDDDTVAEPTESSAEPGVAKDVVQ